MHPQLNKDLKGLSDILSKIKEQSTKYIEQIGSRPTTIDKPSLDFEANKLPAQGQGADRALAIFNQRYEHLMVSSSGPRYWGYVTGGTTPAAIAGDWLSSVYDQNTQSTEGQGDISAIIERDTIAMMCQLFHLPQDIFLGGFVTGATMSSFTCLGVARQWHGRQIDQDIAKAGVTDKINVLSATPHSSAVKALSMLGIGSANIIKVATLPSPREAIDIVDLEAKLQSLDGAPAIIIASGGTVNTVDFDDLKAIVALKEKYNFWLHVDAAFGGFAACSDRYRHLLAGWESADSITVDCHKWLNVPYDSAIFLVRHEHNLHQVETYQNSNAPYLGDPLEQFNYLNFLPENSRRMRALPAWFSLQAYGTEGYAEIVDRCIDLAQYLGQLIDDSKYLMQIAPAHLNNLCFSLRDTQEPDDVRRFLHQLNATGQVFMTPTVFHGVAGIRCSLVNWMTTKEDVDLVFDLMEEVAAGI